jgi:hypothetical protein
VKDGSSNGCGCEARHVRRPASNETSRATDPRSTIFVRRASVRERTTAALIVCAVVAGFGGLWLAQRVGFDFGVLFGPCGMKQRTGLPCPTCGMTTCVLAFARGQVLTAFYVQPAGAFLCSLLVVGTFFAFLTGVLGVYFGFFDRLWTELTVKYVVVGLLVILAAGWAVTLARAAAAQT